MFYLNLRRPNVKTSFIEILILDYVLDSDLSDVKYQSIHLLNMDYWYGRILCKDNVYVIVRTHQQEKIKSKK